jgi:hypothetical protein
LLLPVRASSLCARYRRDLPLPPPCQHTLVLLPLRFLPRAHHNITMAKSSKKKAPRAYKSIHTDQQKADVKMVRRDGRRWGP